MMIRTIVIIALVLSLSVLSVAQQELQVISSMPKGPTESSDQVQTVVVIFNQPMVPLTAVSAQEGAQYLQITPSLPGKYRWAGPTSLTFIPEKRFPMATLFTATVPATVTSLSGNRLDKPFKWTFETPRPKILSSNPYGGQKFVELDHSILLHFNQKIEPHAASKFISIEQFLYNKTTYPRFSAQYPAGIRFYDSTHYVLLRTDEPFQKGARIIVRCKAGLPAEEGNLGLSNDYSTSFTTINELKFFSVSSDRGFDPGSQISFSFSNPVSLNELKSHLWFDPEVKILDQDGYYGNYESENLRITLPLLPETDYRGVVKAGLKDRFGNTLTEDAPFNFRTGSFKAYVRMTTGPGVIEYSESHKYPVSFMNKARVDVQMGKVDPDQIVNLMSKLNYSRYDRHALEEGILLEPESMREEAIKFTHSTTWEIDAKRNVKAIKPLDLDVVLGEKQKGVVFLQLDNLITDERRYLKAIVQVTEMGITAKFSPISTLIWITTLRDAKPVPGASIEIRTDSNKVIWRGTSDSVGIVRAPGWGKLGLKPLPYGRNTDYNRDEDDEYYFDYSVNPRLWVIVKKGDDVAFTTSTWDEGIEPYYFGIEYEWNPKPEKYEGILLTDRGLYKAGEEVEIKGIIRLRADDAWQIARDPKLSFTIRDSRNEVIMTSNPKLSPFGSFSISLPLKPTAVLGEYSMILNVYTESKTGERRATVAYGHFNVEAFRPAEFEVNARTEQNEYIYGDTVMAHVAARYLFGMPLKNTPVNWRISVNSSRWEPPGFDGYFFGLLPWLSKYSEGYGYRKVQESSGTLDDMGMLSVRIPLIVGEQTGTKSMLLEAEVTSPTRQTLAGRTNIIVHEGEFSIGVKLRSTFLSADSLLNYKLVAVTPEGKIIPSESIVVKIFQRIWNSVRKAETGGRYTWQSTRVDSLRDSLPISSGLEPVNLSFRPTNAGFYFIEASGKDKRGNAILTNAYFYVSGSGYVAWERSDDDRSELIADKLNYAPGDIARIIVKSPYESAPALVSVERENILTHFVTKLVGSGPQIEIPITREMLPNAFVSVVLLQGRTSRPSSKTQEDVGKPSFKIGYVKLSVSPAQQELRVRVMTEKDQYNPRDSVRISLQVQDTSGKGVEAEIALSVADLGVLNLINYRLPNPFGTFYGERGLAVTTTETRLHIVEQREYGEKGEDEGGGGALMRAESDIDAEGVRKDFRPSAYWNPSIRTDALGRAAVSFKLPDNLTAFMAMAIAHTTDSKFGYGEKSISVSKPLLLQPSLPRFARVGDRFSSGVVVINQSSLDKKVTVITKTRGISMSGNDSVTYTLGPGKAQEILYQFHAEKIGKGVLTVRAKTDSASDGLQWTIPINAPRIRESVAIYESTTDSAVGQAFRVPDSIFTDIGDVEFTTASTAMVGLSGGMSYLFTYPYYCLEQRCSAILPVILSKELVEAFDFEVYKEKDATEVVSKTLDEIPLFQRENGGFSYWKNTPETYPFVSVYAVYTMIQAKAHGYNVNEKSLKNGIEYLQNVINGKERNSTITDIVSSCVRAMILYTFALNGTPDYAGMNNLYNERNVAPLFAKAYLLKALNKANGDQNMQTELARDLLNRAKVDPTSVHFEEPREDGLGWIHHSTARTTALVLQALVETQPENPIMPKVVRWLLDQRKTGRWRTTQENLFVVDALTTYFAKYEKEDPDYRATIAIEGRTILEEYFKGRSLTTLSKNLNLSTLETGKQYSLRIGKEGKGRLYYGIRMNYYLIGETQAKEEGFSVTKTYEVQDVIQDPEIPFEVGAVVKVTLNVVTNRDRNFVVVDDPLPAGFEAINSSFKTSATEPEQSRANISWAFRHAEKYDDHVLLFADYMPSGLHSFSYLVRVVRSGSFGIPATRVEGMYEPETFGQTASTKILVK